jgi:DNA repair exonuclease SbcCD ATPase subunit
MSVLTQENVALRTRLMSAESLATGGAISRNSSGTGDGGEAAPRASHRTSSREGDADEMDEDERASVEAAEANLRVELHRQVQFLEQKVARAEDEVRSRAREKEQLKADLAKAEATVTTLRAERATLRQDTVRLNDELSQQISETHEAANAAKQAEEENAALRVRVSECESALDTEEKRAADAEVRAGTAETLLADVRVALERARADAAKADSERARLSADTNAATAALTTANTALTKKLSENQMAIEAKQERLAALASRLARGDGDRDAILSAGNGSTPSPPAAPSPVLARVPSSDGDATFMQRILSPGPMGAIEARMLAAVKERDEMQARLDRLESEREDFEERLSDIQRQLNETTEARNAVEQENRIVVEGNTNLSATLDKSRARLAELKAEVSE